ncbi:galactose mutarotase-like [Mya arenaria]|uniref:galactose mutarotase-like n=1 Tax=Mya arenaria TaxID=6604 RepID=UPI0022E97944|nr:galactose mutarotase-like [Mya arenaria]XP_052769481.1 galactose mutarotase-like [Mya arenaria]
MPLKQELFGKTSTGEDVYKFTFTNENKVTISVLNFGCVIYEIKLPDRDGNVVDVNLGFDNVKDYEKNNNYFGALCGRVANRIGNGEMTIDGQTFKLSRNDPLGGHIVHGGFVGFSRRVWDYKIEGDTLTLTYVDADGSEGFPGEVTTHVTFTLGEDNTLTMDYSATTTKTTVVDMGSHFMVNLAGHDKGAIKDHKVTVYSDKFLDIGDDFLPTGKLISVDEDPVMDFRSGRDLAGEVLETLSGGCAFHHAFVFDRRGERKRMARVDHPGSGRYLEVASTNSTVFAYSNHFMPQIVGDAPCKAGARYPRYAAIEFMPMGYPNSVKMPEFPQSVLKPDQQYRETAWYTFGLQEQ